MPLLRTSAAGLDAMATSGSLASRLAQQFAMTVGYRVGESEQRSWERSLPVLARDLLDAGLGDVEVLVEHQLPLSSKRMDAVLCGSHPKTGDPSYVIVELKQWSYAMPFEDDDELVLVDAYGGRPVLHPIEQVRRYATFLADFARVLEHADDALAGVAYLHNARNDDVAGLRVLPESSLGRLFTAEERGAWLDFLKSRLTPASGAREADELLRSRIAPSRKLMEVAAAEIRDREMFVLLDEQQVAYRLVLRAVERARRADAKTAVIVTGGPGSGKSVIALSLLGELNRRGYTALHATGSKAFTETLRKVAGHRNSSVKALFRYFNQFVTSERNGIDVLVADEAHRLRETSASRFTAVAQRTGKPQIDELLDAARVPVFLLDEHQVVRPGELGSAALVRAAAEARGFDVEQIDLQGQFRSGGSDSYDEWVRRLLGLAEGGPERWLGDDRFELIVVDSPEEMEAILGAKERAGYTARITAGFCWVWSDADTNGTLPPDVRVGGWERPWNNKQERAAKGAPARSLWATEAGGFDQVGCVYTAQGFEYDWNGVILGPDLVWRDGAFEADATATRDPAFRGRGRDDFDTFVRNVYKVLLSRGMVGTVVYSTDAATRALLRKLVTP